MKKSILSLLCMMMFFWFVPGLSVQAEEDWQYEYEILNIRQDSSGNIKKSTYSKSIKINYPVYGFYHKFTQGINVGVEIRYASVVPPDVGKDEQIQEVSGTQVNEWASGAVTTSPWDSKVPFITADSWINILSSSNVDSGSAQFQPYDDFTVTFPLFADEASLVSYLKSGDESGWVNKPKEIKLEKFSLLDFTCDNSIRAEWKGVTGFEEIPSLDDVTVLVHPIYFTILENDELEQEWIQPSDVEVPFMNFGFYNSYSNYFENYPYKNGRLTLDFTPIYRTQTEFYRGQTISVYFDQDGNISNTNIPAVSLKPLYDDDFYFNGMLVTEDNYKIGVSNSGLYKNINFMWSGTSIDNIVDYYYSDIKVQIKVRVGQNGSSYGLRWVDYPLNDTVSIIDNRLNIDMKDVQDYVKSLGQDYRVFDDNFTTNFGFKDISIRLVPYYKTYNTYCYGHAVEYRLNQHNGGELVVANGDVFSGSPVDYLNVHDSYYDNHNLFDGLFEGSNSDTSGEFDFSFLSDLVKDFFSATIEFFKYAGSFPALFSQTLSFLPSYYFKMLTFSLVVIFILRILGR